MWKQLGDLLCILVVATPIVANNCLCAKICLVLLLCLCQCQEHNMVQHRLQVVEPHLHWALEVLLEASTL